MFLARPLIRAKPTQSASQFCFIFLFFLAWPVRVSSPCSLISILAPPTFFFSGLEFEFFSFPPGACAYADLVFKAKQSFFLPFISQHRPPPPPTFPTTGLNPCLSSRTGACGLPPVYKSPGFSSMFTGSAPAPPLCTVFFVSPRKTGHNTTLLGTLCLFSPFRHPA